MRSKRDVLIEDSNQDAAAGGNPHSPVEETKDGQQDIITEVMDHTSDLDDDELDENEEEFDDTGGVSAIEVTTDFSKNTPLLFATQAGHTRVVWLLLADGYSPNDVDKMQNNAVHLAAAHGNVKLLQVLINDGGNANAVNHYKNLPLDMAKNKAVRELLVVAMEAGASLTEDDRERKHEQNLKQYQKMTNMLAETISDALAFRVTPPPIGNVGTNNAAAAASKKMTKLLQEAIDMGKEHALDIDMIVQAEQLLKKLEVNQELVDDIVTLQRLAPIRTQTAYTDHVYSLEASIERALEVEVDPSQVQLALDLIARCQTEYWLNTLFERVKDVTIATDSNEHDMNKLRAALEKARLYQADEKMIEKASKILSKLDAELGMYRALKAIPSIKLPMENAPSDYYGPYDVGKVKETEGYPNPPADTGEYVWTPAENLTKFVDAIARFVRPSTKRTQFFSSVGNLYIFAVFSLD